jgi:uncharacterized alkaline shock family protein YloU
MNDNDDCQGKTTIAPEVLLTIAQLTAINVDGVRSSQPCSSRSKSTS